MVYLIVEADYSLEVFEHQQLFGVTEERFRAEEICRNAPTKMLQVYKLEGHLCLESYDGELHEFES